MNDFEESSLPYKFDISLFHTIKNDDILDHIAHVGILFYQKIHYHQNATKT